jgi:hypothetical protein
MANVQGNNVLLSPSSGPLRHEQLSSFKMHTSEHPKYMYLPTRLLMALLLRLRLKIPNMIATLAKKINRALLLSLVSFPPLFLGNTNICIEYLSHGYTLTDQALQKAIEYDQTHGLSARFYNLLNGAIGTAQGVDQRLGVTQRAVAVDEKFAIQEKAKSTASGLMRYFENALGTPTGKKVRSFYDDRKKEALEIHAEARRYIPLVKIDILEMY